MTVASNPPANRRRRKSLIGRISFNQALSINLIVMALKTWQMFCSSVSLSGLICYSAALALCLICGYLYLGGNSFAKFIQVQGKIQKLGVRVSLGGMFLCVIIGDWLILPASAQTSGPAGSSAGFLFTNIQTKLTAIFASSPNAQIITPIITFAFGVLQVLFIMFIAFQAAKVIQASREEEDWLQVAKTPLIVTMAVVGADFAIGLV